ncbi:DUF5814 domain-containing protein [Methanobrevibacter sp. 87.7]|uniref:DUF5814 domain-containing protein n=1 Tax=Methanobrevibacter sp. 87.7 TaxID=387957 RepID=UPI000B50C973|nr:DUF5814 domain-containing protein [Methanobrevibacter sp. 87.7]
MIILKKKKKLWEMYPIGSPKGALNTQRTPSFLGTLKFKLNEKGKMELNRFIVNLNIEENSSLYEKFYPPQEAIKILRSQIVFLANHDEDFENFLDSLNIKYRFTRICDYCVLENKITIINSEYSYKFHNQLICKDCAENTIKEQLKLRGYDKRVFRNFKRILEKTGSLEVVMDMLSPKFDPVSHSDLTLFDKVKVDNNKKIPLIDMRRLKINKDFRDILISHGNVKLLPVQILAIKEGLLRDENILAVSATSSGKTLIGELAGVPKALNGEKFIFLTPLVALANQKYRDFKEKYKSLGLKVSIKVGKNRVKAKGELRLPDKNVHDSDIVVGTYEALDYMIRSGNYDDLNNLGVVLIDEIHMLDDEDRGTRLNGLIKRLSAIFPRAQLIGLSATIKNPEYLADKFNMNLVKYENRPVPLERHISFVRNESQKRELMRKFIIQETHNVSSKGYKGQTIIFTNSRRKTTKIASFLMDKGIKASAYHAGLSYSKKSKIEKRFDEGKLEAVVTTAALAAGVDFPASQVIFDTLLMGNKWIGPNEFSQMLGRAGRPSYHDRGIVYLLPEIGKEFDNDTEEAMALNLLESDNEDVEIVYDEEQLKEQILADISSGAVHTKVDLEEFYENTEIPSDTSYIVNNLIDNKFVEYNKGMLKATRYGRAVTMSFLSIEKAQFIKDSIFNSNYFKDSDYIMNNINNILNPQSEYYNDLVHKSKNKSKNVKKDNNRKVTNNVFKSISRKELNQLKVKTIAMDLELFSNAYLSPSVHNQIANKLKMNVSSRLFAESTLDIISSGDVINKLDSKFQDALIRIQVDFLRCDCIDKPFCDCLQRGISYLIINERLNGEDPINISKTLFNNYQIHIYPGDIFSWLDNYIKNLDAVKRVAYAFDMNKLYKQAEYLISQIENPHNSKKDKHIKVKSSKKNNKKSRKNNKHNHNLSKDSKHKSSDKNIKINSKKSSKNSNSKSKKTSSKNSNKHSNNSKNSNNKNSNSNSKTKYSNNKNSKKSKNNKHNKKLDSNSKSKHSNKKHTKKSNSKSKHKNHDKNSNVHKSVINDMKKGNLNVIIDFKS